MKSLVPSTLLHAGLLAWGLWSFGAPEPLEIAEAVPVSLVPITDFSEAVAGAEDAPLTDTPSPEKTLTPEKLPMPAEHVGDNEVDLDSAPTPQTAPREHIQTASAEAPPPPTPEPEPESTPEPAAAETPPPEPVSASTPPPEPVKTAEPPPEAVDEMAPPANIPVPQSKPKPPVQVAEVKPEPEKKVEPEKKPEPEKKLEAEVKPEKKPDTPKKPDAETKAETKPDTPKKTDAKKTDPKKSDPKKSAETKVADNRSSQKSEFDADKISDLLDREKSAGGGAKRSAQQASLGATRTTGTKLSQSEIDGLREATEECWTKPSGSFGAEGILVEVSFELEADGSLRGQPHVVASGGDPSTRRAYEGSATRAVRICAQRGKYKLSAESLAADSEFTFNFRADDTL